MTSFFRASAFVAAMAAAAPALANEIEPGTLADEIDYIVSHGISVIDTGEGPSLIVVETDFGPDTPPDLHMLLGRDGVPDPSANLGQINRIAGLQVFEAPRSIDLSQFDALHIWDAGSGRALGAAPF